MIAGGSDLAQTCAFPEEIDERMALPVNMAECQPFAKDDRPGKQRKKNKQYENGKGKAASLRESIDKQAPR